MKPILPALAILPVGRREVPGRDGRIGHRFFCTAEFFALAAGDVFRFLRTAIRVSSPGRDGLTAPPNSSDEIAALMPASCFSNCASARRNSKSKALKLAIDSLIVTNKKTNVIVNLTRNQLTNNSLLHARCVSQVDASHSAGQVFVCRQPSMHCGISRGRR